MTDLVNVADIDKRWDTSDLLHHLRRSRGIATASSSPRSDGTQQMVVRMLHHNLLSNDRRSTPKSPPFFQI